MSNGRNLGLLLGTSTVVPASKLSDVFFLIDSDYVQIRQSASSGGSSITAYDSSGILPPINNNVGDLGFLTNNNTLQIWNGVQWLDTNRTVENFYYFVQIGVFDAPVIGQRIISPSSNINLVSVNATIDGAQGSDLIYSIMKNGNTLETFSIQSGQTQAAADFSANTNVNNSDQLSVNVISGSAKDLVVKLTYKEI
jgi:hypothetical protein